MTRLLLALTFVLSAPLAVEAANTPFTGRWAEDPAWCRNTRSQGEIPVMITLRSIETSKVFCRVLAAVRMTDWTWRLNAFCRDEGETEGEPRRRVTVTLRLERDRLLLKKDSGIRRLVRCSP